MTSLFTDAYIVDMIEEHSDSNDDEPVDPPVPTHNEMLDMCDKMYTYLETPSNSDKYFAFASSLKAFATANQCHSRKQTHVTDFFM